MHCEQAEMLIPQYIFNELTVEDSVQVTEHLKTCVSCTQTCKELKEASGFLEAALKAPKEKKFSEEKRQQILAAFSELKPIVEPIALTEAKNEISKKPSFDFKTFFMSIAAIFLVLVGIAGISPMFQGVGDTRSDGDRNVTLGYYDLNENESAPMEMLSIQKGLVEYKSSSGNYPTDYYGEGKEVKNQNSEYAYSLEDTQKKLASKQEAVQNTEQSSDGSNDRTTGIRIGRYSKPIPKTEKSLRQEMIVASKEKQTIPKNQNELGNRGIGFDDNVQDFNNNVVYDGIKPKTQNKAKWGEKSNNTPSSPRKSSDEDNKQQVENIKLDWEWEKDTEINKSGVIMTRKKGMAPDLKQLEEGEYYIGQEMAAQTIKDNLKANSYGEANLDDIRKFKFNRNKKAIVPEEDSRWRPDDDSLSGFESWYKKFPEHEIHASEIKKTQDAMLAPLSNDTLGGVDILKNEKTWAFRNFDEPVFPDNKFADDDYLDGGGKSDSGYVVQEQLRKLPTEKDFNTDGHYDKDVELQKFKAGIVANDRKHSEPNQIKSNLTQEMSEANIENGTNQQKGTTIADGIIVAEELGSSYKYSGSGAGYLSDVRKLDDYNASGVITKSKEISKNNPPLEEGNSLIGVYEIPFQDIVHYPAEWEDFIKLRKPNQKDGGEEEPWKSTILKKLEQPGFAGPSISSEEKVNIAEPIDLGSRNKLNLDADTLIGLIKEKIARDTWDESKGTSIENFQGKLIVNHTEEVQKKAEAFLEELRESIAKAETKQVDEEEVIDVAPVKPEQKKIIVNPFVNTAANALSTFSIDTDSASYYVCRQSLSSGVIPQESIVRPEEFINAFDYNYCLTGNKTFAISTEYMQNPLNANTHILKVGIKGKVLGRDGRKPVHVVLVVDTSGSMAKKTRLPLVKKGIEKLVTNMHPGDHISLVTYSNDVTLNLEYTPIENIDKIQDAVEAIKTGGSTDLARGVMVGYQIAANHFKKSAMNQVIICSDGVANVGHLEADKIIKRVEAFKKQGVSFTSIGFGLGDYNDQLLQKLALRGDGFYFFVNSEEDANRVFEREIGASFHIIAKDAKLQVAFKKNRVHRYRLIGYEARDVKDKDFRNNAVDGGEIISGKSVTSIYEIELAKAESVKEFQESLGTVTVRFQNIENNQWEEDTVAIAGKSQVVNQPKDNPYFYLAYSVATFAEIMRKSPYVKPNAIDQIETYVKKISEELVLNDQVKDLLKNIQLYQKLTVKDK